MSEIDRFSSFKPKMEVEFYINVYYTMYSAVDSDDV